MGSVYNRVLSGYSIRPRYRRYEAVGPDEGQRRFRWIHLVSCRGNWFVQNRELLPERESFKHQFVSRFEERKDGFPHEHGSFDEKENVSDSSADDSSCLWLSKRLCQCAMIRNADSYGGDQ